MAETPQGSRDPVTHPEVGDKVMFADGRMRFVYGRSPQRVYTALITPDGDLVPEQIYAKMSLVMWRGSVKRIIERSILDTVIPPEYQVTDAEELMRHKATCAAHGTPHLTVDINATTGGYQLDSYVAGSRKPSVCASFKWTQKPHIFIERARLAIMNVIAELANT